MCYQRQKMENELLPKYYLVGPFEMEGNLYPYEFIFPEIPDRITEEEAIDKFFQSMNEIYLDCPGYEPNRKK